MSAPTTPTHPTRAAYTVAEFANATTLSESTVYRLIASGRIRPVKVGARTLIPRQQLDELLIG